MFKLTVALLFIALAIGSNADDDCDNNQNQNSLRDLFDGLDMPEMPKPLTADDIKNLQKPENGHSQGSYQSSSSSMQTVNGKVVKQEASGESVLNKDGNVSSSSYQS